MVWGPGTYVSFRALFAGRRCALTGITRRYGYLPSDLSQFYSEFQVNSTVNSVFASGFPGVPGGDNFGEATLDVSYT